MQSAGTEDISFFNRTFKPQLHFKISESSPALDCNNGSNFHKEFVTPEEVQAVINSRNNKKTSGDDSMPIFIIKFFNSDIIKIISVLFNHIIAMGHFPNCWRHAIVTPIPKAGKDNRLMDNWRPISMLNSLSKIFERIIADRMRKFCEDNNVIPQHQFGFQRGHSTSHPLALLQNKINDGLNNKSATVLICLDIKAAFDTVWHDGLIFKLNQLNFPSYITNIINTFLRNRSFKVKFHGSLSSVRVIAAGVPQGSVLGPLLFNIYCHDFPTSSDFLLLQFADDTAVAISSKTARGLSRKINNYLERIACWYANWKMVLNATKSECIKIVGIKCLTPCFKRSLNNLSISIGNSPVLLKNVLKYLGVNFATNNRMNRHIETMLNKANAAKFMIRNLLSSQLILTKFKILLYTLYTRPIIPYASPVWLNPSIVSSAQIEKIRVFERKALRQALNVRRSRNSYKFASNNSLYKKFNRDRIDVKLIKMSIKFHDNNTVNNNSLIKNLTLKYNPVTTSDLTYKRSDYIYNLHVSNQLFNDNCTTLFNRGFFDKNKLVYSLAQ